VSAAKVAMKLLTGVDVGPPISPNVPLTDASAKAMEADFKASGYL